MGLLIEEIANPFYATIAQVTAEVAASFDSLLITVGIVQEMCRREVRAAVTGFDDFELSHPMPIPLTVVA